MDTLRVFFAMIAAENLECRQYDIKNAFTEVTLNERRYLSVPIGVPMNEGYSSRALKIIYGLKQAARDWNTTYHSCLKNLGFSQSLVEPYLYTHQKEIILLVYVDNVAVATRNNLGLV